MSERASLQLSRRGFLGLGAALVLASQVSRRAQAASPLLVFTQSAARARALELELTQAMKGEDLKVFGRVSDFYLEAKAQAEPWLMAPPIVLKELGLTPQLQGLWKGKDEEPYAEVKLPNPSSGSSASVGMIELVPRTKMPALAKRLLNLSAAPSVTRVTKVEDLLGLLVLEKVGRVLLPERLVSELTQRSAQPLQVSLPPTAKLGVLAAACPQNPNKLQKLRQLPNSALVHLGLEVWK